MLALVDLYLCIHRILLHYFLKDQSLDHNGFLYTYPLRNIVSKYNLSYHSYADDTQLYMSFKPSQKDANTCISCLEDCIRDIRLWMKQNFLKLKPKKTGGGGPKVPPRHFARLLCNAQSSSRDTL